MKVELRAQGIALMIVRLVLGALMLYYGLQNVFGFMGGQGITEAAQEFSDSFAVPAIVGYVAFYGELIAGVFLLAGFLTRVAAFFVGSLMAIAAVMGIRSTETIVKTTSDDPLAAVGYPTALLALSLVLILLGAGLWAVDTYFVDNTRSARQARKPRD